MKVFIDRISGDEFLSDSYPATLCYNDALLEVKGKYGKKGSDRIVIASDEVEEEGDDDTPIVCDLVDKFNLNEVQFSKKDVGAWAKDYLKKVVEQLEKVGKADRVPEFKKGATEFIKLVMSKHDEFQFWCGQKYDVEAHIAFSYNKDGEEDPSFYYWNDGLKVEKY